MKQRMGFVSNSSSSSFVIVGIKTDYNTKEYNHVKELFCDAVSEDEEDNSPYEWDYPRNVQFLSDDGTCYFGRILSTSSDGYMEYSEHSTTDILATIASVAKTLELPVDSIKLFTGERSC
jgi:hypothetical protein